MGVMAGKFKRLHEVGWLKKNYKRQTKKDQTSE